MSNDQSKPLTRREKTVYGAYKCKKRDCQRVTSITEPRSKVAEYHANNRHLMCPRCTSVLVTIKWLSAPVSEGQFETIDFDRSDLLGAPFAQDPRQGKVMMDRESTPI